MSLETTRNLSLIWLSLLCFVALLPPIILLYFIMLGLNWVKRQAIPLFQKAQQGSNLVQDRVQSYSELAADPLIKVKGRLRRWQKIVVKLLPNG